VVPAIACSLGVRESAAGGLRQLVRRHLRGRRLLLLLDNLEHLLPAAPDVAALLEAAPGLAVLATSRSALRVRGEQVHEVPPLALAPAVELFLARAGEAAARPTPEDRAAAAEVCRRLDRLPLAIELAAARTRVLPPQSLLARLDQAFALLAGGARDLPERQRALRLTIAWSHDLLDPAERALFRRLAVFSGGWTLDAAAAAGCVDELSAVRLHASLTEQSLLTRLPFRHEPRFGLLETIRLFAAEELERSGERETVRARHARHHRNLAVAAGPELHGPAQAGWLDRLQAEHENLVVALRWLRARGQIDDFARAYHALWPLWWIRGQLRESGLPVEEALAVAGQLDPPGRTRVLFTAGLLLAGGGRVAAAVTTLGEAALAARAAGDLQVLAWTLVMQGFLASGRGEHDLAGSLLAEAERAGRAAGDRYAAAQAVAGRTHAAIARGDLDGVERTLLQSEAEVRELGAPWTLALTLNMRARIALLQDEPARAGRLLRESVSILGRLQDTWAMRPALTHLANSAVLQSDPERAALLYGAADGLAELSGPSIFPVDERLSAPCRAAVVTSLGPDAAEALRKEGRSLHFEEVVAMAAGG
jgi:predicted ATPase